jgi:hypothetical protein
MTVLAALWPDYAIGWAYDGTAELAAYVGVELRSDTWDRQPTLQLAQDPNELCHLVSVVDATGQLRMWPLWWHLSKAWHGPELMDKLPGRGVRKLTLGKIPEGGVHVDVPRKTLGAWQTADTMGVFQALPDVWRGWQTEIWEDRFEEQVRHCNGALRVPELDLDAGVESARAWIRGRVFQSYADSPAGQVVNVAKLLTLVGPGLSVGSEAVADHAVRPSVAEWSRFVDACDALQTVHAASA